MPFPSRTPPYEVDVKNWPNGRSKAKPYRQVRRFQIAAFNTDYTVPNGEEWVIRSMIVFFTTAAVVGDRYWYFYIRANQDPTLDVYQAYHNKHAYAINGIYTDVLGVGLDTANFQYDTAGLRFGSTQPLVETRLINGDSFYFGFQARAGDAVQATVLYEVYDESGY